MKIRFVTLILLLAIPVTAYGHTEIFFPKLFSQAELPNSGFVFVNPDPFTATVNIYLISSSGSAVSSTSRQIAKGGQLAILGSELFPDPASGGWVYVINDAEGMQAFWLNYDAGITFLDGAEAAQYDTIGADQIIPLIAGQAELNVINPNFSRIPFTIQLYGSDGPLAPAVSRELPVAGAFQAQAFALFPSADMTQARYIRVRTAGASIASSAVIRSFLVPTESVVLNALNAGLRTELNFPHIVNGALSGANYTTIIGVTNVSTSNQTVTITFNPDLGNPISVSRTISSNGALRETAQSLFSLPSEFQSGWVRITGTSAMIGFAAYADSVAGGFAVVPAGVPQTNLFFSHIADGPPQWQTGLALLNPGNTPASVEIYAVNASGSLIGDVHFTMVPGQKIASVVHELVPQTRGTNGGFVYVRTTNGVPLYGIELFYTEDLRVLSNVSAGKLVGGVNYVPPSQ